MCYPTISDDLRRRLMMSNDYNFETLRIFWNEDDEGRISEFAFDDGRHMLDSSGYTYSGGACYGDWPHGELEGGGSFCNAGYAIPHWLAQGFSNDGVAKAFIGTLLGSEETPPIYMAMLNGYAAATNLFRPKDKGRLTITVSGGAGSGKTYWCNKISRMMQEDGIKVDRAIGLAEYGLKDFSRSGAVIVEVMGHVITKAACDEDIKRLGLGPDDSAIEARCARTGGRVIRNGSDKTFKPVDYF
jgi:hypothetical protein